MEYFLHGDLQQHLDNPLPELDARKISLQVLDGLHCMHQNAYSHRDLKPKVSSTESEQLKSAHVDPHRIFW